MNRAQRRLIARGVYPSQIKPDSQEELIIAQEYVEECMARAAETGESIKLSEHDFINRLHEAVTNAN